MFFPQHLWRNLDLWTSKGLMMKRLCLFRKTWLLDELLELPSVKLQRLQNPMKLLNMRLNKQIPGHDSSRGMSTISKRSTKLISEAKEQLPDLWRGSTRSRLSTESNKLLTYSTGSGKNVTKFLPFSLLLKPTQNLEWPLLERNHTPNGLIM